MSYAIRKDGKGWRAVGDVSECNENENYSMEQPAIVAPSPRERMSIPTAQAMLNLKKAGLLAIVDDAISKLDKHDDIVILWNRSPTFERLNPVLVEFCHNLHMTDSDIDALFIGS